MGSVVLLGLGEKELYKCRVRSAVSLRLMEGYVGVAWVALCHGDWRGMRRVGGGVPWELRGKASHGRRGAIRLVGKMSRGRRCAMEINGRIRNDQNKTREVPGILRQTDRPKTQEIPEKK